MHTFDQEPKAQQTRSTKSTIPGRAHFGQSREVDSILHLQRMIGNQAVQRLSEASTEDVKGHDSSTTEIARFGHDFSRMPVYANAPGEIQSKLTVNAPEDAFEQEAEQAAQAVALGSVPQINNTSAPATLHRAEKEGALSTPANPAFVPPSVKNPGKVVLQKGPWYFPDPLKLAPEIFVIGYWAKNIGEVALKDIVDTVVVADSSGSQVFKEDNVVDTVEAGAKYMGQFWVMSGLESGVYSVDLSINQNAPKRDTLTIP